ASTSGVFASGTTLPEGRSSYARSRASRTPRRQAPTSACRVPPERRPRRAATLISPKAPSNMLEPAEAHLPRRIVLVLALGAALLSNCGCGKDEKKDAPRPPAEVTVLTVAARDVPISSVFVAQ